jgi:hypothetical protein
MGFEYIEVLYNRKRQHSSLGYKSPIRFLDDWLITSQKEKLVACTPPFRRRKTGGNLSANFLYKTTDYYAPEFERSLVWNDPKIAIA